MATFQSVFAPAEERNTQITLTATTASSDITSVGSYSSGSMFVITVSGNATIRFGNAANIGNPDATDFPIYANTIQEWTFPTGCDRFRVFNPGASSITVNYWGLVRG